MDTVVLDGVEYVRAAVAAKRFKYTTDYIGQLCRGKKVDARLVGRSWYVNPESIKAYKIKRHQQEEAISVTASEAAETPVEPSRSAEQKRRTPAAVVPPRLKSSTLKQLATHKQKEQGEVRSLRVNYEPDHGNLFPELKKQVTLPPRYIKIEPAEAKKLGISGPVTTSSFAPTKMPEVALSGKLQVTDYPDVDEAQIDSDTAESELHVLSEESAPKVSNSQHSIKNNDISDKQERGSISKSSTLKVKELADDSDQKIPLGKKVNDTGTGGVPGNLPVGDFMSKVTTARATVATSSLVGAKTSTFTPQSVTQIQVTDKTGRLILISPLLATLVAVVFVFFILLGSVSVVVTNDAYDVRLVFQMANLLDLLER